MPDGSQPDDGHEREATAYRCARTRPIFLRSAAAFALLTVGAVSQAVWTMGAASPESLPPAPSAATPPTWLREEGDALSTQQPLQPFEVPIGIIIMAQGRSGSTMMGEFFRQNEDVLYWYEPCRSARHELHKTGLECLSLVRRLVNCDFTTDDSEWMSMDQQALGFGSQALSPLVVEHSVQSLKDAHNSVLEKCRNSRAAVVKTIRLSEGVDEDDPVDSKGAPLVLHLVRDPRAVVKSEMQNFHISGGAPEDADEATQAGAVGSLLCGTYRKQLDSTTALDHRRYLRVRYEDVATSPELAVQLIYCWTGLLPVPTSVSDWVRVNTQLPGCGNVSPGEGKKRNRRALADVVKDCVARNSDGELNVIGNDGGGEMTPSFSRHTSSVASHRFGFSRVASSGNGDGCGSDYGSASVNNSSGAERNVAIFDASTASCYVANRFVDKFLMPCREENSRHGTSTFHAADHSTGSDKNSSRFSSDSSVTFSTTTLQPSRRRAAGEDGTNMKDKRCFQNARNAAQQHPYGTHRDSASMVNLWRTQMSKKAAGAVWEACKASGVMKSFEYTW